jgi:hypothetical protein
MRSFLTLTAQHSVRFLSRTNGSKVGQSPWKMELLTGRRENLCIIQQGRRSMTHLRIFALLTAAAWVFYGINSGWCQGVAAFGPAAPLGYTPGQILSLPEPDLARAQESRACNMSIPLVGGGEMANANIDTLRQSIAQYPVWEREYTESESLSTSLIIAQATENTGKFKYLYWRQRGVSAKTIDLFARTFLVRKLYADGRDDEALAEANKLIADYNLRPAYHQIDEAELDTYLADDTLGNATFFFATLAKLRLAGAPQNRFSVISDYLQIRDELLPTIGLFHQNDSDKEIISEAGVLAVDAGNGRLGKSAGDTIIAAWRSADTGTNKAFVVIDGKPPTTLSLALGGGGMDGPPRPPPQERLPSPAGSDGGFSRLNAIQVVDTSILSADRAHAAYRRFVERQLARYSTSDMSLFDVQRDDEGALLTIALPPPKKTASRGATRSTLRTIRISDADFSAFISSQAGQDLDTRLRQLFPKSGPTAVVAYSNPFVVRDATYRDVTRTFAFQLQKVETGLRVYRDPLSAATVNNVRVLSSRLVGKGSDYIAYIDDGSFNVTDFNIIQDIRQVLTRAGVQIVNGVPAPSKPGPSKNVIVISGHSNEQLAAFVEALGKAGAFKNNFVILNSCETPLTQEMLDRVTQEFGARAAFSQEGQIPASGVEDMLVSLSDKIRNHPRSFLVDILRSATQGSGLNGIWNVCDNWISEAGRCSHG